ncbi:hypothetical protein FRC17_008831, partial [Serendipita sp. 399]
MTTQESAMSKIPTEIWLDILECVISSEHFFACRYSGGDWSRVAQEYFLLDYRVLEHRSRRRQIITLGMVCKTWKRFMDNILSPRFVWIPKSIADHTIIDDIVRAERVLVTDKTSMLSELVGKWVHWRIFCGDLVELRGLEKTVHPDLRRLELVYTYYSYSNTPIVPYNPHRLVESLSSFTDIVWLGYRTSVSVRADCTKDDGGPRITLPNLEVLKYHGESGFHLPFYRLNLPSLRHLAIRAPFNPDHLPVWQMMVDSYGKTLHSLYIQSFRGGFTFRPDTHPYFPNWEHVPHLRELGIDAPISLQFHPLPSIHPLRVFAAEIWGAEDLSSWFDSESLQ